MLRRLPCKSYEIAFLYAMERELPLFLNPPCIHEIFLYWRLRIDRHLPLRNVQVKSCFRSSTQLFLQSYMREIRDSGVGSFWIGATGIVT